MTAAVVIPSEPLAEYVEKGEAKFGYFNPAHIFSFVCVVQERPGVTSELFGDADIAEVVTGFGSLDLEAVRRACPSPALIRGYGFMEAGSVAVRLARSLGAPAVISGHIPPITYALLHARQSPFLRKPAALPLLLRWRQTLRAADAVLCVSQFVADEVRRLAPHAHVEVNYNRVHPSFFRAPVVRQRPRLRLLTIGRLYPTKNHATLFKAVALDIGVELLVVGRGPLEPSLRRLADQLGIAERITWIPSVRYLELPALYADADAYVMASEGEGFCNVVLEAMASGLPVVVSRREPFLEVCADAGFFVDHSPEGFVAAFKQLRDEARRRELGAGSFDRARELMATWTEEREAELVRAVMRQA